MYTNLLGHSSSFSNGVRPHALTKNSARRHAAEPMAHARNGNAAKISMKVRYREAGQNGRAVDKFFSLGVLIFTKYHKQLCIGVESEVRV